MQLKRRLLSTAAYFFIMTAMAIGLICPETASAAVTPKVAAGYDYTLSLKSDGTVWAWGSNGYGMLGNGSNTDSNIPVQVSGLTEITTIAAGGSHGVALKSGGTVWNWGNNSDGQLGNTSNTDTQIPVQVSNISGVTAVAAGMAHTVALKSDGTVWAWGKGDYGQLGNGDFANKNIPVQVSNISGVIAIACGEWHTIALKNDGTVWSWGAGIDGQQGNGSFSNSYQPSQVSTLSGMTAIAAGGSHTVAVKSNGTVWAWGDNIYGQLGNGNAGTDINIPVQVSNISSGVTAAATGTHYTVALKSDGTVWAWGRNTDGQLGNASNTDSNIPVKVSNIASGVTSIDAGNGHTVVLKNDGTVWTFGKNSSGQLGNGTNGAGTYSNIPVQVTGLNLGATPDPIPSAPTTGYRVDWSDKGMTGPFTMTRTGGGETNKPIPLLPAPYNLTSFDDTGLFCNTSYTYTISGTGNQSPATVEAVTKLYSGWNSVGPLGPVSGLTLFDWVPNGVYLADVTLYDTAGHYEQRSHASPGKGYFVKPTAAIPSILRDTCFPLAVNILKMGYSLIAPICNGDVSLWRIFTDAGVKTIAEAIAAGMIDRTLYYWNGKAYDDVFIDTDKLEAGKSYWILNTGTMAVDLEMWAF